MLSYKTKDGKVTELEAQGSLTELLSDTTFLAHAIYGMLARSDEGSAKAFQAHFALLAADPESPMWENSNPNCISIVRRAKPRRARAMTSDEVLTALRCCASGSCDGCPLWDDDPEDTTCADGLMAATADLIKFQQQGLEALTKMDEGLKKRGGTLKEFLRRGDEVVQGHRDPAGPLGNPGFAGDIFICPTCNSPRVFYNAEKDAYICPSCGWQNKEG